MQANLERVQKKRQFIWKPELSSVV
jgi:hypothetical protein